ncbi:MAG: PepSY domain-containing protein [Sphingobacteriales bacterium]|nr:MAG: PepSY domain-containing protein [Sphingobacteriales bacterium]
MTVKKAIGTIHLWLGLASGLLVLFLGITGCILAFQREIEMLTVPSQYVEPQDGPYVPPSRMYAIATKALPGKTAHSVTYGEQNKAAVITYYNSDSDYYYLAYINPYTGKVIKVKNMDRDFFRVIVDGHFYLWLPPNIGKPIVASATLVFFVMMVSGIVLWWPKNKAARKQRFKVKWDAKWRRVNYDLHNVFGFYMSWVAIFIAITGLIWGFEWVSKSVYWVTSGGKEAIAFYEPVSKKKEVVGEPIVDQLWRKMQVEYKGMETLEVHYPETDSSSIEIAANPDASTYWKADYRYFDQYTMQEIEVTHAFGRFANTKVAEKISRMNYDIHVGAVLGLPGKIMAFCASLIAASLPVTGFYIWWGRRNKKPKPSLAKA